MKPNCFGLPSILNLTTDTCNRCPVRDECVRASRAMLVALSGRGVDLSGELEVLTHYGSSALNAPGAPLVVAAPQTVTIPLPTVNVRSVRLRIDPDEAQREKILLMPVKVARKYKALVKKGYDVRAPLDLAGGVNPFPMDGARYLHIAADMLLDGGCTRQELIAEMRGRLDWSKGTAESHATQVFQLMPAINAAVIDAGRLVLTPTLTGNT